VLLGSAAVEICIHRDEFERAIGDLLERTMVVTKRCLEGAGIRPADADAVLLIGGSSMIPSAVKTLRSIFCAPGQRVLFHEPTKAVAFGAALRAAQITGTESKLHIPPELRGVSGYNVGIRTIDPVTRSPRIDTLIKKNLPLPARARRTYYTHRADQTRIVVDVVQHLEATDTPVTLGQLTVGPIASPRVNYPIDIALENREDGTIAVQAYDPQTGVEIAHVIERDREDPVSYLAPQRTLVRSTLINNL
jgi:molecular chaperone DnaK